MSIQLDTQPSMVGNADEIYELALSYFKKGRPREEALQDAKELRNSLFKKNNIFVMDKGVECEIDRAYKNKKTTPPTPITEPNVTSLDLSDQGLTDAYLATKPLLKYITDERGWVGYSNGRWSAKETPTNEIGSVLRKLEPADLPDKLAARIHRHLNSKAAVAAVTFFAEARPELAIKAGDFDPDPMLLGLPHGEVLDLKTGERRAATPGDLITRALPVAPKGSCQRWLEYLKQAHPNDPELIAYLQRWAGYCLTASTQEDMILFLIGVGGSGKGTFAEPVQKLLGDYCVSIPIGMLLESTNEDRRLNYIASLRGARLAICNEGSKMQKLDSRGIKLLTGGGWLTGRRLGHQPINFKATHKIVVLANDNPVLELDDAMKQRVHVVPFNQKFRGENTEEKGLREFFAQPEQLQGIFAWMVEGCLAYQKDGLKPPASVVTRTERYFEDMDTLERFKSDHLIERLEAFTPTKQIWPKWVAFCHQEGCPEEVGSPKTFIPSVLAKYLFPKVRAGKKNGVRGLYGIQLLEDADLVDRFHGEQ